MRLPAFVSSFLLAALLVPVAAGHADVSPSKQAEAAKMNNLGTALMNQQLLDKAAAKFADAYQLDPALVQAEVNRQTNQRAADARRVGTPGPEGSVGKLEDFSPSLEDFLIELEDFSRSLEDFLPSLELPGLKRACFVVKLEDISRKLEDFLPSLDHFECSLGSAALKLEEKVLKRA